MKTKKIILILPVFLFVIISCNMDNEVPYNNCIMDTLKGEWSWIKTYTPKHGIIDNEFKSILKVFNQNENASINYEVLVGDTIYYSGSFQYQYGLLDDRIDNVNIKLPHWTPSLVVDENWFVYFGDMLTERSSNDTLTFWDGTMDGYFYYYEKIRKE